VAEYKCRHQGLPVVQRCHFPILAALCSQVYIIHRRDEFRASKIMQKRTLAHPKIEVVWSHVVVEAYGNEKHRLGGLKLQSTKDGSVRSCKPTSGLIS